MEILKKNLEKLISALSAEDRGKLKNRLENFEIFSPRMTAKAIDAFCLGFNFFIYFSLYHIH
ncbi:MAG: hypothetical protein V1891_00865 [bacterium]